MIVELNLYESKIFVTINPDDIDKIYESANVKQLLFDNIDKSDDIKYKFAISLQASDDSVQLKSFSVR